MITTPETPETPETETPKPPEVMRPAGPSIQATVTPRRGLVFDVVEVLKNNAVVVAHAGGKKGQLVFPETVLWVVERLAEQSAPFRRGLYALVSTLAQRLPVHPDAGKLEVAQVRESVVPLGCVIAEATTRDQTQVKRFSVGPGGYIVERRYLADGPDAPWACVGFSADVCMAVNTYNRLS